MTEELILFVRLSCHVITVIMLARYFNPSGHMRWDAVICAGLLMASSASLAVQIMTSWHEIISSDPQPQQAIFAFSVMMPIVITRGNMAHIIDWVSDHVLRIVVK